jgi:hypothetical protein
MRNFLLFLMMLTLLSSGMVGATEAEVCPVSSNDEFKLIPEIKVDKIADACNWEYIFNISDYFSLDGLMNAAFDKLKDKVSGSLCKITAEDIWENNEDIIGYEWPLDVLGDVIDETNDEYNGVLDDIYLSNGELDISGEELEHIKTMLEVE